MIAVSTFALFFLGPADPANAMCDLNCPPERYFRIRHSLGVDRPVVEQFTEYMGGIIAGRELKAGAWVKSCPAPCFGYSFRRDRPVTEIMLEHLPVTVSITLGGALICLTFGVLIGNLCGDLSRHLHRQGNCGSVALVRLDPVLRAGPHGLPRSGCLPSDLPAQRISAAVGERPSPGRVGCCWLGSCSGSLARLTTRATREPR
jgi:hypothetical protein